MATPVTQVPPRNIVIERAPTKITLEDLFWEILNKRAEEIGISVNSLATQIARENKEKRTLSSAIRLWIVNDLLKTIKRLKK